jgi:dephospho-CoA kinase
MIKTKQIIGITGGIGSGKSVVANILNSMGYPVYNSDDRAKILINRDSNLILKIKESFGNVYNTEGLDRQKMANIVFNNPEKLALLNSLVHPAVGHDFDLWVKKQSSSLVFKEAAILFETGIYKSLNKVILVTCPLPIKIKRVMERDSVSQEDVENRMKNQWSDEQKIKLSDYVIDNSGNKLLIPQVQKILNHLTK